MPYAEFKLGKNIKQLHFTPPYHHTTTTSYYMQQQQHITNAPIIEVLWGVRGV